MALDTMKKAHLLFTTAAYFIPPCLSQQSESACHPLETSLGPWPSFAHRCGLCTTCRASMVCVLVPALGPLPAPPGCVLEPALAFADPALAPANNPPHFNVPPTPNTVRDLITIVSTVAMLVRIVLIESYSSVGGAMNQKNILVAWTTKMAP